MEHCEEGDLRSQLHKKNFYKRKFEVEQVIDWAFQIASALKFCHDRTVIHRDLKVKVLNSTNHSITFQPENIFLTKNGRRVKLGDFGVSIETKNTAIQAVTFTGTYQYMAPEMLRSK